MIPNTLNTINHDVYNKDLAHLKLVRSLPFSADLIRDKQKETDEEMANNATESIYGKPNCSYMLYDQKEKVFFPLVVKEGSLQDAAIALSNELKKISQKKKIDGTYWVTQRDPYLHVGQRKRERILYKVRTQKNVTKLSRIKSIIRRFSKCDFGTEKTSDKVRRSCHPIVDLQAVLESKVVAPQDDVYQIRILSGPYRVRFGPNILLADLDASEKSP